MLARGKSETQESTSTQVWTVFPYHVIVRMAEAQLWGGTEAALHGCASSPDLTSTVLNRRTVMLLLGKESGNKQAKQKGMRAFYVQGTQRCYEGYRQRQHVLSHHVPT